MASNANPQDIFQFIEKLEADQVSQQELDQFSTMLLDDRQALVLFYEFMSLNSIVSRHQKSDKYLMETAGLSDEKLEQLYRDIIEQEEKIHNELNDAHQKIQKKKIEKDAQEQLEEFLQAQSKGQRRNPSRPVQDSSTVKSISISPFIVKMVVAACLLVGLSIVWFSISKAVTVVATVTDTIQAQWAHEPVEILEAKDYHLISGLAEIMLHDGTKITLEGPSEISFESTSRIYLGYGKLVADVAVETEGFTVYTPGATIVDLGTEFGVHVDDNQTSHLVVFEGSVTIQPHENESRERFTVTKGEMMVVELDSPMVEKDMGTHHYVRNISQKPVKVQGVDCHNITKPQFRLIQPAKTIQDNPGLNYNGVDLVSNVPDVKENTGQYSMKFDRVNDHVRIKPKNHPLFHRDHSELTYTLWVNFTELSPQTILFAPYDLNESGGDGVEALFEVYLDDVADGKFVLGCTYYIENEKYKDAMVCVTGDVNISKNQWYHLSLTMKHSTLRLYLDGQLIAESVNSNEQSTNGVDEIVLGNFNNAHAVSMEDRKTGFIINDFAIYTRTLSLQNITCLATRR